MCPQECKTILIKVRPRVNRETSLSTGDLHLWDIKPAVWTARLGASTSRAAAPHPPNRSHRWRCQRGPPESRPPPPPSSIQGNNPPADLLAWERVEDAGASTLYLAAGDVEAIAPKPAPFAPPDGDPLGRFSRPKTGWM